MARHSKPNWIDRAVAFMSPEYGARRAAYRSLLNPAGQLRASYAGGVSTRTDRTWSTSRSAMGFSRADRTDTRSMRDRARAVDRDNPIGHGILNRIVDNVIGTGMTLQARTDSPNFNREAEQRFADWFDRADIRGMLSGAEFDRQVYRAIERDGDVGIVLVDRGGESRLQMIAGDLIKTPTGKHNQGSIIDGVETNSVGRPLAFHIADSASPGTTKTTRIAASNFVFLPRLKRGGTQIRGESAFTPVFPLLDQVNGYVDAVVIAARMGAVFGLIFREQNAAKAISGLPSLTNSQGDAQKALTLEAGSIKYIGKDDDVVQVQPQQPVPHAPEFVASMLRLIGLPFDMPLELVLFDFSRVNFSSARASLLQFYRAMKARQNEYRTRCKSRVYQWWISREIKQGRFTTEVPDLAWSHEFHTQGWQWVDPVKELQAALLEIDMGINTRKGVAASLGRDYETVLTEQIADEALRRASELPHVGSTFTRDRGAGVELDDTAADDSGDDDSEGNDNDSSTNDE